MRNDDLGAGLTPASQPTYGNKYYLSTNNLNFNMSYGNGRVVAVEAMRSIHE